MLFFGGLVLGTFGDGGDISLLNTFLTRPSVQIHETVA